MVVNIVFIFVDKQETARIKGKLKYRSNTSLKFDGQRERNNFYP